MRKTRLFRLSLCERHHHPCHTPIADLSLAYDCPGSHAFTFMCCSAACYRAHLAAHSSLQAFVDAASVEARQLHRSLPIHTPSLFAASCITCEQTLAQRTVTHYMQNHIAVAHAHVSCAQCHTARMRVDPRVTKHEHVAFCSPACMQTFLRSSNAPDTSSAVTPRAAEWPSADTQSLTQPLPDHTLQVDAHAKPVAGVQLSHSPRVMTMRSRASIRRPARYDD
jgi:hypothetical protein